MKYKGVGVLLLVRLTRKYESNIFQIGLEQGNQQSEEKNQIQSHKTWLLTNTGNKKTKYTSELWGKYAKTVDQRRY